MLGVEPLRVSSVRVVAAEVKRLYSGGRLRSSIGAIFLAREPGLDRNSPRRCDGVPSTTASQNEFLRSTGQPCTRQDEKG